MTFPNLRWSGDFSMPRLRSQLARKYEFHPDVEPEYGDNYKISLGKMLVERKDFSKTMPAGFGVQLTGSTVRGQYGQVPIRLWRGPAVGDEALHGQDWSKGGSGGLSRSGSAASSRTNLSTAASTTALSNFYSPQKTAKDHPPPREKDPAEGASRRLWRESQSAVPYIKEYIQELKEAGAPDAKSKKSGADPLAKAPVPGVQKALKDGGKLEWQNPDCNGMTLLLRTARQGEVYLMGYLLAIGADLAAVDYGRRSVLHWASSEGHALIVELALNKLGDLGMGNAMVHGRDLRGDTPLHLACLHGHLPIVKLLCGEKRASASPHVQNFMEETPLHLAQKARMHHIVRYLTQGKPVAETVKLRDMDRDCNHTIAAVVRLEPNPKKPAAKKAPAKKK